MFFQGIIKFGNISNYFDSRDIKFRPEPGKQTIRLMFSLRKESCGDKKVFAIAKRKGKVICSPALSFQPHIIKNTGKEPLRVSAHKLELKKHNYKITREDFALFEEWQGV